MMTAPAWMVPGLRTWTLRVRLPPGALDNTACFNAKQAVFLCQLHRQEWCRSHDRDRRRACVFHQTMVPLRQSGVCPEAGKQVLVSHTCRCQPSRGCGYSRPTYPQCHLSPRHCFACDVRCWVVAAADPTVLLPSCFAGEYECQGPGLWDWQVLRPVTFGEVSAREYEAGSEGRSGEFP